MENFREELERRLREIEDAKPDERADLMIQAAFVALRVNPSQAEMLAREVLAMPGIEEVPMRYGNALLDLALARCHLSANEEGIAYFLQAAEAFERGGSRTGQANAFSNIGNAYGSLGDFDKALDYMLRALIIKQELGDEAAVLAMENNIASVYQSLGQYDLAMEYITRVVDARRQLGDEFGLSGSLNNLGSLFMDIGDQPSAERALEESLTLKRRLGHVQGIAMTVANLGQIRVLQGRLEEARDFYEEALAICKGLGYRQGEVINLKALGEISTRQGDYAAAESQLWKALEIAREIEVKEEIAGLWDSLSNLYAAQGDFEKALDCARDHQQVKSEYLNESHMQRLAEMQARFDITRKARENEVYRLRNIELAKALDDLKAAQAEIVEWERKASALAMAVTANHEINQPLMILQGSIDLLQNTLPEEAPRSVVHLKRMQNAIERIQTILERYRNVSRMSFAEYSFNTKMVIFDEESPTE
jgi:tetratricopeptide (TPR) repeat protein